MLLVRLLPNTDISNPLKRIPARRDKLRAAWTPGSVLSKSELW